jgi:hypothetical protein
LSKPPILGPGTFGSDVPTMMIAAHTAGGTQ